LRVLDRPSWLGEKWLGHDGSYHNRICLTLTCASHAGSCSSSDDDEIEGRPFWSWIHHLFKNCQLRRKSTDNVLSNFKNILFKKKKKKKKLPFIQTLSKRMTSSLASCFCCMVIIQYVGGIKPELDAKTMTITAVHPAHALCPNACIPRSQSRQIVALHKRLPNVNSMFSLYPICFYILKVFLLLMVLMVFSIFHRCFSNVSFHNS